jgi:hypothetical protein
MQNKYWHLLRRDWRFFVGLFIGMEILAVLFLVVAKPRYETDATIAASEFSVSYSPQSQSALGALSGLSLLGINDRPPSLFTQFLDLMSSTVVADRLLAHPAVVGPLFPEEWDSETQEWRRPTGPIFELKQFVKMILGMPAWHSPDKYELAEYLDDHLVKLTNSNGLVNVWIRTKDPALGNRLLQTILGATADVIRGSVESSLQRQIDYMQKLLGETSSVESREAQISLATEAEKKIILIRSGSPIGAQVIEPVYTDPRPASPRAPLVLGFAGLGSVALYLLLTFLRNVGFTLAFPRVGRPLGALSGQTRGYVRPAD